MNIGDEGETKTSPKADENPFLYNVYLHKPRYRTGETFGDETRRATEQDYIEDWIQDVERYESDAVSALPSLEDGNFTSSSSSDVSVSSSSSWNICARFCRRGSDHDHRNPGLVSKRSSSESQRRLQDDALSSSSLGNDEDGHSNYAGDARGEYDKNPYRPSPFGSWQCAVTGNNASLYKKHTVSGFARHQPKLIIVQDNLVEVRSTNNAFTSPPAVEFEVPQASHPPPPLQDDTKEEKHSPLDPLSLEKIRSMVPAQNRPFALSPEGRLVALAWCDVTHREYLPFTKGSPHHEAESTERTICGRDTVFVYDVEDEGSLVAAFSINNCINNCAPDQDTNEQKADKRFQRNFDREGYNPREAVTALVFLPACTESDELKSRNTALRPSERLLVLGSRGTLISICITKRSTDNPSLLVAMMMKDRKEDVHSSPSVPSIESEKSTSPSNIMWTITDYQPFDLEHISESSNASSVSITSKTKLAVSDENNSRSKDQNRYVFTGLRAFHDNGSPIANRNDRMLSVVSNDHENGSVVLYIFKISARPNRMICLGSLCWDSEKIPGKILFDSKAAEFIRKKQRQSHIWRTSSNENNSHIKSLSSATTSVGYGLWTLLGGRLLFGGDHGRNSAASNISKDNGEIPFESWMFSAKYWPTTIRFSPKNTKIAVLDAFGNLTVVGISDCANSENGVDINKMKVLSSNKKSTTYRISYGDVSWWSDSHIITVTRDGRFAVQKPSSLSLISSAFSALETFEPWPRVTERIIVPKRKKIWNGIGPESGQIDDSHDVDTHDEDFQTTENISVFVLACSRDFYRLESQEAERLSNPKPVVSEKELTPPSSPTRSSLSLSPTVQMSCRYDILRITEQAPRSFIRTLVERNLYDDAVLVARKYRLAADPIFHAKWMKERPDVNLVQNTLSKIQDHWWVLGQIVSRPAASFQAAEAMFKLGLQLTDHLQEEVDEVRVMGDDDIGGETALLLAYRFAMILYLKRLRLFCELNQGSFNESSHKAFIGFRTAPSLIPYSCQKAAEGDLKTLRYLRLSPHSSGGEDTHAPPLEHEKLSSWCEVLEHIPETINPSLYEDLLPPHSITADEHHSKDFTVSGKSETDGGSCGEDDKKQDGWGGGLDLDELLDEADGNNSGVDKKSGAENSPNATGSGVGWDDNELDLDDMLTSDLKKSNANQGKIARKPIDAKMKAKHREKDDWVMSSLCLKLIIRCLEDKKAGVVSLSRVHATAASHAARLLPALHGVLKNRDGVSLIEEKDSDSFKGQLAWLSRWYEQRVISFDTLAGQLDHALVLCIIGKNKLLSSATSSPSKLLSPPAVTSSLERLCRSVTELHLLIYKMNVDIGTSLKRYLSLTPSLRLKLAMEDDLHHSCVGNKGSRQQRHRLLLNRFVKLSSILFETQEQAKIAFKEFLKERFIKEGDGSPVEAIIRQSFPEDDVDETNLTGSRNEDERNCKVFDSLEEAVALVADCVYGGDPRHFFSTLLENDTKSSSIHLQGAQAMVKGLQTIVSLRKNSHPSKKILSTKSREMLNSLEDQVEASAILIKYGVKKTPKQLGYGNNNLSRGDSPPANEAGENVPEDGKRPSGASPGSTSRDSIHDDSGDQFEFVLASRTTVEEVCRRVIRLGKKWSRSEWDDLRKDLLTLQKGVFRTSMPDKSYIAIQYCRALLLAGKIGLAQAILDELVNKHRNQNRNVLNDTTAVEVGSKGESTQDLDIIHETSNKNAKLGREKGINQVGLSAGNFPDVGLDTELASRIVLAASREHFDASGSVNDTSFLNAKCCLDLIPFSKESSHLGPAGNMRSLERIPSTSVKAGLRVLSSLTRNTNTVFSRLKRAMRTSSSSSSPSALSLASIFGGEQTSPTPEDLSSIEASHENILRMIRMADENEIEENHIEFSTPQEGKALEQSSMVELEVMMERWLLEAVERLSELDNTVVPFQVRKSLTAGDDRLKPIKQALMFKGVYKKLDQLKSIGRLLGLVSRDDQCLIQLQCAEAAMRAGDVEHTKSLVLDLLSSNNRYRPAWKLCLKLLQMHKDINADVFQKDYNKEQKDKLEDEKDENNSLAPLSKSNTTIRIASALVRNVKTLAKTAVKGAINVTSIKNKLLVGLPGGATDDDEELTRHRMIMMMSGFSATTWELLMGHCLWGCNVEELDAVLDVWKNATWNDVRINEDQGGKDMSLNLERTTPHLVGGCDPISIAKIVFGTKGESDGEIDIDGHNRNDINEAAPDRKEASETEELAQAHLDQIRTKPVPATTISPTILQKSTTLVSSSPTTRLDVLRNALVRDKPICHLYDKQLCFYAINACKGSSKSSKNINTDIKGSGNSLSHSLHSEIRLGLGYLSALQDPMALVKYVEERAKPLRTRDPDDEEEDNRTFKSKLSSLQELKNINSKAIELVIRYYASEGARRRTDENHSSFALSPKDCLHLSMPKLSTYLEAQKPVDGKCQSSAYVWIAKRLIPRWRESIDKEQSLEYIPSLDMDRLKSDIQYRYKALLPLCRNNGSILSADKSGQTKASDSEKGNYLSHKGLEVALSLATRLGLEPPKWRLAVEYVCFLLSADAKECKFDNDDEMLKLVDQELNWIRKERLLAGSPENVFHFILRNAAPKIQGTDFPRLSRLFGLLSEMSELSGAVQVSLVYNGHKGVLDRLNGALVKCNYYRLVDPRRCHQELEQIVKRHNVFILSRIAQRLNSLTLPNENDDRDVDIPATDSAESVANLFPSLDTGMGKQQNEKKERTSGVTRSMVFDVFLRRELDQTFVSISSLSAESRASKLNEFLDIHSMSFSRLTTADASNIMVMAARKLFAGSDRVGLGSAIQWLDRGLQLLRSREDTSGDGKACNQLQSIIKARGYYRALQCLSDLDCMQEVTKEGRARWKMLRDCTIVEEIRDAVVRLMYSNCDANDSKDLSTIVNKRLDCRQVQSIASCVKLALETTGEQSAEVLSDAKIDRNIGLWGYPKMVVDALTLALHEFEETGNAMISNSANRNYVQEVHEWDEEMDGALENLFFVLSRHCVELAKVTQDETADEVLRMFLLSASQVGGDESENLAGNSEQCIDSEWVCRRRWLLNRSIYLLRTIQAAGTARVESVPTSLDINQASSIWNQDYQKQLLDAFEVNLTFTRSHTLWKIARSLRATTESASSDVLAVGVSLFTPSNDIKNSTVERQTSVLSNIAKILRKKMEELKIESAEKILACFLDSCGNMLRRLARRYQDLPISQKDGIVTEKNGERDVDPKEVRATLRRCVRNAFSLVIHMGMWRQIAQFSQNCLELLRWLNSDDNENSMEQKQVYEQFKREISYGDALQWAFICGGELLKLAEAEMKRKPIAETINIRSWFSLKGRISALVRLGAIPTLISSSQKILETALDVLVEQRANGVRDPKLGEAAEEDMALLIGTLISCGRPSDAATVFFTWANIHPAIREESYGLRLVNQFAHQHTAYLQNALALCSKIKNPVRRLKVERELQRRRRLFNDVLSAIHTLEVKNSDIPYPTTASVVQDEKVTARVNKDFSGEVDLHNLAERMKDSNRESEIVKVAAEDGDEAKKSATEDRVDESTDELTNSGWGGVMDLNSYIEEDINESDSSGKKPHRSGFAPESGNITKRDATPDMEKDVLIGWNDGDDLHDGRKDTSGEFNSTRPVAEDTEANGGREETDENAGWGWREGEIDLNALTTEAVGVNQLNPQDHDENSTNDSGIRVDLKEDKQKGNTSKTEDETEVVLEAKTVPEQNSNKFDEIRAETPEKSEDAANGWGGGLDLDELIPGEEEETIETEVGGGALEVQETVGDDGWGSGLDDLGEVGCEEDDGADDRVPKNENKVAKNGENKCDNISEGINPADGGGWGNDDLDLSALLA